MNIEGKNAVYEALKADTTIEGLLVEKGANHPIIALAREKGIKIQFVEKNVLDKVSVTKKHQGFIAKVTSFNYSDVEDILKEAKQRGEEEFIVLLDGVEDPHNLGSILRVCECAGVHGIIIPKNRAVGVNETVIKTSAGASNHIKVAKVTNLTNTINDLKKAGLWIFAADMGGKSIYETNLKGRICLVIGGEGKGVSRLIKENCDGVISLSMRGKINSLNASVACGVAVYEALRQRQ
jgi:23S rRNA (guanosine2251-2'-O)-methyltransferase